MNRFDCSIKENKKISFIQINIGCTKNNFKNLDNINELCY